QPVRGLPHPLGVLHLQTNLVLPSLLITRQRSLLFKVTDCRLSGQPPCDHGCLYPAPVCWHDHASSVADRHHPISVGPREGSINISATSCSTSRSVMRYSMFVATAYGPAYSLSGRPARSAVSLGYPSAAMIISP